MKMVFMKAQGNSQFFRIEIAIDRSVANDGVTS